jgi:hypothetical protein
MRVVSTLLLIGFFYAALRFSRGVRTWAELQDESGEF